MSESKEFLIYQSEDGFNCIDVMLEVENSVVRLFRTTAADGEHYEARILTGCRS